MRRRTRPGRIGPEALAVALATCLLTPPVPASAQDIGGASARLGFARPSDGSLGSGGVAAEARFVFRVRGFELGPKVGYASLGPDLSVWDPGVIARVRIGGSEWTPTLSGGLSGQLWSRRESLPGFGGTFRDQDGYLGGELGLGLLRRSETGPGYGLELSVRRIIQHTAGFEPGAFWTLTAGIETGW